MKKAVCKIMRIYNSDQVRRINANMSLVMGGIAGASIYNTIKDILSSNMTVKTIIWIIVAIISLIAHIIITYCKHHYKNRNGRVYTREAVMQAVNSFNENNVSKVTFVGEIEHPADNNVKGE